MKKAKKNSTRFLKQIFAFGLVFFLLVSTCSIQNGIKSVFGIPIEMTKTTKNAKIATTSFGSSAGINTVNCTKCSDVQILLTDGNSILKTIGAAVFFTAFISLLFSSFSFTQEDSFVYKTPDYSGETPRYLLFSRLLYYDIR